MPAKRKDYRTAVRLYNSGLSIQAVADHYGISRQGMYEILKRRGVAFRTKKESAELLAKWRKKRIDELLPGSDMAGAKPETVA